MTASPTLTISLGLRGLANDLEKRLIQMTGTRQPFILVIMTGDGVVQHVSNTHKEDRIVVLRELIDRWERGEPEVPAHDNKEIK